MSNNNHDIRQPYGKRIIIQKNSKSKKVKKIQSQKTIILYPHTKWQPYGNPLIRKKKKKFLEIRTNQRTIGLISADRSNKATLLLTIPRSKFKSSAKDLSSLIFEVIIQGWEQDTLPRLNRYPLVWFRRMPKQTLFVIA